MVTMTMNTHHIEKTCEIIFEDLLEKIFFIFLKKHTLGFVSFLGELSL